MDLEVRSNNDLKYRRNFCQAIFGLLQIGNGPIHWTRSIASLNLSDLQVVLKVTHYPTVKGLSL